MEMCLESLPIYYTKLRHAEKIHKLYFWQRRWAFERKAFPNKRPWVPDGCALLRKFPVRLIAIAVNHLMCSNEHRCKQDYDESHDTWMAI